MTLQHFPHHVEGVKIIVYDQYFLVHSTHNSTCVGQLQSSISCVEIQEPLGGGVVLI
jgi:hypothetical protein